MNSVLGQISYKGRGGGRRREWKIKNEAQVVRLLTCLGVLFLAYKNALSLYSLDF